MAAYDRYQKSRNTECFSFNRYCDIQRLLAQHSALVLRDDYIGGNRWLDHLERDLMAFWGKAEVREMRHGLYRSFLTDDGKPLPGLSDSEQWPPELRRAIVKNPDGSYTAEAGSLLEGPEKNADKNFVRSLWTCPCPGETLPGFRRLCSRLSRGDCHVCENAGENRLCP